MRTEDVLDQIDGALDDWEVGPDAMRCGAPPSAAPPLRFTPPPSAVVFLEIDISPFQEAMARFAEYLAQATPKFLGLIRVVQRIEEREALRRHQPIPLAIDGQVYRQRQRKRRRS